MARLLRPARIKLELLQVRTAERTLETYRCKLLCNVIGGLLLASHTLEAPSSIGNVDMGAYAGRLASQRALELAASA